MPTKKPVPSDTPSEAAPRRPSKAKSQPRPEKPKTVDLGAVYGLFKLSPMEQQLVEALRAQPGSTVSELATSLKQPHEEIQVILGPHQVLRAAAIVEVDASAELGHPHPSERLFVGRGLTVWAQRRDAMPPQLPGLSILPAPEPDASWAAEFVTDRPAQQVLELVKEKLVSTRPLLLFLSGSGAETTSLIAQAVRLRLSRPVFFVDAGALSGVPMLDLMAALRRLRRDADLRGAALVVQDADLLGAGWRALTHPKPVGQTAPVLLCSAGSLTAPKFATAATYGSPLQPHAFTLRVNNASTAVGTSSPASPQNSGPETEPSEADRSREEARRQAALDAARAMGKPIPKELLAPAPAAVSPSPIASAPATTAAPTVATAPAVRPAVSPEPPPSAPVPIAPAAPAKLDAPPAPQATQAAARPTNPRLAAALAKAGLLPQSHSEAAPAPAARPASEAVIAKPAPVPAPSVPSAPTSAPPAPAPMAEAAAPSPGTPFPTDEEVDGPPLPLADDAKLDDLVNIAKTTTSMRQRAELLTRLAGTKSPAVIQLFRLFCTSPNTAVRLAAEAGMASLFGANWNRARVIAPPVQPPRTDDGGRGPGGAF